MDGPRTGYGHADVAAGTEAVDANRASGNFGVVGSGSG